MNKKSGPAVGGSTSRARAGHKQFDYSNFVDTTQVVFRQGDTYTLRLPSGRGLFSQRVYRAGAKRPVSKRGVITGFSKRSRKRLMVMLARHKWKSALFVTLTARDPEAIDYSKIVAFVKRYWRRWGKAAIVWRRELQKRGAWHAHLLIFTRRWLPVQWIIKAWSEILGESGSVDVEFIPERGKVGYYIAKYIAKVEEVRADAGSDASALPGDGDADAEAGEGEAEAGGILDNSAISCRSVGRIWGFLGREFLKLDVVRRVRKIPLFVFLRFASLLEWLKAQNYVCDRVQVVFYSS